MSSMRNSICSLAVIAAAGLTSTANAQALTNGSFETLAPPGGFIWDNWLNFGNSGLNDLDIPGFLPFDNSGNPDEFGIAVKTFGEFFYAFPLGLDDLPDGFPVDDLPVSSVPYDTLPTNNTVVFQIIGDDDGVDDPRVGDCARATIRYWQRSDADQLNPVGNLPTLTLNFRDDGFPAPVVDSAQNAVVIGETASDEWVELVVEGTIPPGTDFIELLILHFQFGVNFTVVDNDNDGVQDIVNGFPAFDIPEWGQGAAHWDLATFEVISGPCASDECAADFNGDGSVNVLDVVNFITGWNAQDPETDVDMNGQFNILDVISFINTWNAGCP